MLRSELASRLTRILVLSAQLWWCASAGSQDIPSAPGKPAGPVFASEKAKAEALGKVRLLADLIRAMKDDAARVQGLAMVGRAACNFDPDLARETFGRALEIMRAAEPRASASLRWTLLPQIARCDPGMAYSLNAAKLEDENDLSQTADAAADISAASMLREEDPAHAGLFLRRAVRAGLSDGQMQSAMLTLMKLRTQNMAAADATFLFLLARLRAELRPEADRVLLVGNYLFMSPPIPGMPEQARADGIMLTSVGSGRQGRVGTWNLTEDRPGMNPAMVRPYLEAALDIFSRPVQEPSKQASDFVALQQLAGKVPRFAPDLAPQFALLRDRLAPHVAETLRQPASYRSLSDPNSGPSIEDRIAAEPNPIKRDEWRLRRLSSAASRDDMTTTRKHVAEIEDKELREAAIRLLQFFDAAKAISDGKLQDAEGMIRSMLPGAKRALLALDLASAYLEKGEREAAESWWTRAIAGDTRIRAGHGAGLLLAVAGTAMRFDHEAGLAALDSAVQAFNSESRSSATSPRQDEGYPWNPLAPKAEKQMDRALIRFTGSGFWEEVYHGNYATQFRLVVKAIGTVDFSAELMIRTGKDAERTQAIVVKLEDESRRATALASLARAYLETATKPVQKAASSAVP